MRHWIVMIDDDTDMHFLYQRVFEKLGLLERLVLFENGREALNFLTENYSETKLIFSDINMPVMDGLQLRAIINKDQNPELKSIPFIYLSTSARDREVKAAYELMVQGFFQKGETLQDLENCIKVVLNYWGKCTLPELTSTCL